MANYWIVEPEVGGSLGPSTRMDRNTHPPRVFELEYQFQGWLGDVLLESFPVYILTEAMSRKIRDGRFSGVEFDEVRVTTTPEFLELQPDIRLPNFVWMKPTGVPGVDDFGMGPDHRLVVSTRALNLLQSGQLLNAEIEPWQPTP